MNGSGHEHPESCNRNEGVQKAPTGVLRYLSYRYSTKYWKDDDTDRNHCKDALYEFVLRRI